MGGCLSSCCLGEEEEPLKKQRDDFHQEKHIQDKATSKTKPEQHQDNSSRPLVSQIIVGKTNPRQAKDKAQSQLRQTHIEKSRINSSNSVASSVKSVPKDFEPTVQEMLKNQQSVQQLLNVGCKAYQLNLWNQAGELYCKAASILIDQRSNRQYSPQTIKQTLLYIYHELIAIEMARNQPQKADKYYRKCLQLYDSQPESMIIQEKITLLNNYALFLREHSRLVEALQVCRRACELVNKYYTFQDARRYHTLINLAVLEKQSGNSKEADAIYRQIENCKDHEIRYQASNNKIIQEKSEIRK